MSHCPSSHETTSDRLARRTLFAFLMTFLISRTCVFLIMSHRMPNLFLFVKGTHVHHLNYGIFLLAFVAGYSIFQRPHGRAGEATALAYGVALGLTFDEFGMWLNLGGSYWQRASVDGVIVLGALIALLAYARCLERLEARHFRSFISLAVALAVFGTALYLAGNRIGGVMGPKLRELEVSSSP
jgi:hypothetical protein